jgi:protein-tyrosine phosphatase
MIDLHSHMLFGLDDGSPDLNTSLKMAEIAVEDGITHTVCTPHASFEYTYDEALINDRLVEFRAALAARGIAMMVARGCDFHLSYDNLQDAYQNRKRYTINGGDYLLIELSDHGISPNITNTLYDIRLAGMTPILTHPERNPTIQAKPGILIEWLQQGLLLQLTANSITGGMGKKAQELSHTFLGDRWAHFIATDAHGLTRRPSRMSEARSVIAKRYGEEYADLLCTHNPTAVYNNQPLPPQIPPENLYDDIDTNKLPWWRRIFR